MLFWFFNVISHYLQPSSYCSDVNFCVRNMCVTSIIKINNIIEFTLTDGTRHINAIFPNFL